MPLSITFRRAGLAAAMLVIPPLAALADTVTVQRIGDGMLSGVSADGLAAVGMLQGSYEVYRWTQDGGVEPLGRSTFDTLGHGSGIPRISANGKALSATILSDDGTYSTAGRWTPGDGWKMLGAAPGGGSMSDGEDSSAFGLSGNGKVVTGLFWRPGKPGGYAHAMKWTPKGDMVDMGSSGMSSRIDGASYDGSVLAGWDEHPMYGNRRAAVWVKGVRTVLVDSDWPSEAAAVNSSGTIVVGESADPANGFQQSAAMWKWNGQGWDLQSLGNMHKDKTEGFAFANSVSDDGSVVVGTARLDYQKPTSLGFIWTPAGGMMDLEAYLKANGVKRNPLYRIFAASAVTPDGSVIAATEQQLVAPFKQRSLLIRRQP